MHGQAGLTQPELDKYLGRAIQTLADELMKANDWMAEQSIASSVQSFNAALPDRIVDAPGQFLRIIVAEDQKVGVIWYGIRGQQEALVWDLLIYPEWRDKGFGAAALAVM